MSRRRSENGNGSRNLLKSERATTLQINRRRASVPDDSPIKVASVPLTFFQDMRTVRHPDKPDRPSCFHRPENGIIPNARSTCVRRVRESFVVYRLRRDRSRKEFRTAARSLAGELPGKNTSAEHMGRHLRTLWPRRRESFVVRRLSVRRPTEGRGDGKDPVELHMDTSAESHERTKATINITL